MNGQLLGYIKKPDGERLGAFWLHIDPDRTSGYALYREPYAPDVTRVIAVSKSIGQNGPMLLARADATLENEFNIPEENRLPSAFTASLQIDREPNQTISAYFGTWSSGDQAGLFEASRVGQTGETPAQQVFAEWDSFKLWANKYSESPGNAFRGQGARHRLQTSFHRTGRVDIIRYIRRDLPVFLDYVETVTGMRFTLADPNDFGSIIGFAQHHGFPTPLLDWTHSPYVAAYFAFAEVVSNPNPPEFVRIFRLESGFVQTGLNKATINTIDASMTVTAYRPHSRGNGRLLNQQGLFLFSNVVDIEGRLRMLEADQKINQGGLLEVVDIRSDQARRALADLRNMGTTSATLFPGLDGVAAHLKHSLFFAP